MLDYRPSLVRCSSPGKRIAAALPLLFVLVGCAVTPQSVLPTQASSGPATLPTVYTDLSRLTAPSNETPVAVNFKTSTQPKLQAAQHWGRIAEDTARSIGESLRKVGQCAGSLDPCKAIYVNPPVNITEFSRAFYNQVITALVKADVVVAKAPGADMTLDIDVQPILFSPNRPQYRYAGSAIELGPGVWALRDVAYVNPNDGDVIPPSDDATHWFRSEFASGRTPQFEILVTTSVGNKIRYLARTTNAYYVADGDRRLYNEEICSLIRPCDAGSRGQPAGDKQEAKRDTKPMRELPVISDCPLDKCVTDGITLGAASKPNGKSGGKSSGKSNGKSK